MFSKLYIYIYPNERYYYKTEKIKYCLENGMECYKFHIWTLKIAKKKQWPLRIFPNKRWKFFMGEVKHVRQTIVASSNGKDKN